MDPSIFATLILLATVMLRLGLIVGAAWLFVPKRRRCPHCGATTLPLVTPAWLGRLRLQRRWCPCGWSGISKRFSPDDPDRRTRRSSGPRPIRRRPAPWDSESWSPSDSSGP